MILGKQQESGTVRVAVLASGRGSNFEALCNGNTGKGRISLLLTDNPNAPVLEKASLFGVEALYSNPGKYRTKFGLKEEEEWTRILRGKGIELVCLAGLMRIIKGPMLEEYNGSILNIHPSLLPSFPGLNAQEQALDYGVKISGCTVHYVDAGVDSGPIVLQQAVSVEDDDTIESLSERILIQEHLAYCEAVRLHCSGNRSLDGRRFHKRILK